MRLGVASGSCALTMISTNPSLSQLPMHKPVLMQMRGFSLLDRNDKTCRHLVCKTYDSITKETKRNWLVNLIENYITSHKSFFQQRGPSQDDL